MMSVMPKMVRILAAVLLVVAMSGCYLPARFDAEIEITRDGYYSMIFDGYMASVPLYDGLRKGEITPAEERRKVDVVLTDLRRDSATTEARYIRQGHFKVHWEKEGDLLQTRMITFFRRNEAMLSLKYVKTDGIIEVIGKRVRPTDAKRLDAIGLAMTGEVRVLTPLKVAHHNAFQVRRGPGRQKIYVWKINSLFDPPVSMTIPIR